MSDIDTAINGLRLAVATAEALSSALGKAKDALDEIATPLKDQKGYIVEVQGFSSGRGSTAIENSRQMAQMVVRYLVLNHNVPVYRVYTVGMGNAPIQAEGKTIRTRGGRVEISLLKNDLEQLASGSTSAAPATTPQTQAPQQQQPPQQPQQ